MLDGAQRFFTSYGLAQPLLPAIAFAGPGFRAASVGASRARPAGGARAGTLATPARAPHRASGAPSLVVAGHGQPRLRAARPAPPAASPHVARRAASLADRRSQRHAG